MDKYACQYTCFGMLIIRDRKMKYFAFFLLLCVSVSLAADKFVKSCQTVWDANAKSIKSLRAEMHMDMDFSGHYSSQKMDIMLLFADSNYSKIETDLPVGRFTMICHGDTSYSKIANSDWKVGKSQCNENPMKERAEILKNKNLSFVKDSSQKKIYKDESGVFYVFEPKTCRLLETRVVVNGGDDVVNKKFYEKINDVDFVVKEETIVPSKNSKQIVRYESVLINKGVLKSFFEVK